MALRLHETTTTVSAAVEDSYASLQELRDEVQEAYDNTPDSLKQSESGSAREECVSALDQFCDDAPDLDGLELSEVLDLRVVYGGNRRRRQSRSDRRDDVVRSMHAAADVLEGWVANAESEDDESAATKYDEDHLAEVTAVVERLREHADEADGVEFPGR